MTVKIVTCDEPEVCGWKRECEFSLHEGHPVEGVTLEKKR